MNYYSVAPGPGTMPCPDTGFSWSIGGGYFVDANGNYLGQYTIGSFIRVMWTSGPGNLSVSSGGCYAARNIVFLLPPGTTAPVPQAPAFAGNTNNLCSGDQVVITAAGASSPYAFKYYWEVRTNGGAYSQYATTDANNINYTVPAISGAGVNTVEFRVMTRMVNCYNITSNWINSGPLYVNPAPPAFTVGTSSAKICNDPGSVSINITSDNSTTEYFFGYLTSTGEDGSVSFIGNGQHTVSIPFTTPANSPPVTVTFRLRYGSNGTETPSVCASADKQVTLADNSYKLSLTAVGTQERCHNTGDGSVNLTVNNGTGPYTYQWTGGRTTKDISGLSGGQRYKVAAFDIHGCTDTTSAYVKNPPVVKVDNAYVTSDHNGFGVSCHLNDAGGAKNDGTLQVEGSGGTDALSYRLQGGAYSKPLQASTVFTGVYPDSYTVYVQDAKGCEAFAALPVQVTSPPVITYSSLDTTRLTCAGVPDGSITITEADGGYGTYQYMVDGGVLQRDNTIRSLAANTYTVTIRDDNGCTQTGTAVVKQPALLTFSTISSTPQSCAEIVDGTITLTKATGGTGARTYSLNDVDYVPETASMQFSNLTTGNYILYVKDALQCRVSKPYGVGAKPVLAARFAVATPISCYGRQDGAINMTPGGGTAPYTFIWSTNATTEDIADVGDGLYTVTLHDSKGCEKSIDYNFEEPGLLTLQPDVMDYHGSGVRCKGGSDGMIDLTVVGGTGPFNYTWSTGSTQEDINALAPGTYDVSVVDSHGCTADSTDIVVTEPMAVGVSVVRKSDVLCWAGNSGEIEVNGQGGSGVYAYSLNNTTWQGEATFKGLKAIRYTIYLRDENGCTTQTDTALTQPLQLITTLARKVDTTCDEANGSAEVETKDGTKDYSYTWYNEDDSIISLKPTADSLASGDYRVVTRDAHACEHELTVIIDDSDGPKIAQRSLQGLRCHDSNDGEIEISVDQGLGPYTINWDTRETSLIVGNLTGGLHWVEVFDSRGCRSKKFFDVGFPPALALDYTITEPSCYGNHDGIISLTATGGNPGGYSYAWSTGETTPSRGQLAAGLYNLTVTDSKLCSLTQVVEVPDPALFVVDAGGDRTICVGQKLTVRAEEDNATYRWTSDKGYENTTREIVLTEPAEYTLTVVTAKGCTGSDRFALKTATDLLKADFLMASEGLAGDTIVLVDVSWPIPGSIDWDIPEGAALVMEEDVYAELVFAEAGEYEVTLNTHLGECIDQYAKTIIISGGRPSTGGRTGESILSYFEVYPNPNNGDFTVDLEFVEKADGQLLILPVSGGDPLVKERIVGQTRYNYAAALRNAASGIYFVIVQTGGRTFTRRMIIR